jgi:SAM-dependent methyltransferase
MSSTPSTDASAGYEAAAEAFQAFREDARVGADAVATWARTLPSGAEVLELGCGAGVPVTEQLARAGCAVWGIDASPALLSRFRERFPQCQSVCEDLAASQLFGRTFDAAIAVGVIFLLSPDTQRQLICQVATSLAPGGEFLFTAPGSPARWNDILTGKPSHGLGTVAYATALDAAGLALVREFEDEGANHYFLARKGVAGAPARDAG